MSDDDYVLVRRGDLELIVEAGWVAVPRDVDERLLDALGSPAHTRSGND